MARLSFHHPAWSLARDWPESIKTLAQRLRCMRKKHRAADCQLITPFAAGLGVLSWKNWVAHLHICHTHVLSHTCLRSDKPSSRSQEKCCTVSSADTQKNLWLLGQSREGEVGLFNCKTVFLRRTLWYLRDLRFVVRASTTDCDGKKNTLSFQRNGPLNVSACRGK